MVMRVAAGRLLNALTIGDLSTLSCHPASGRLSGQSLERGFPSPDSGVCGKPEGAL